MEKKGEFIAIRPEGVIEARFKLTAKQNDILDMVFTQIKDDDKTDYIIDIAQYKKFYNVNTSNLYRDLEKAVTGFEGKGLHLTKANSKGHVYFAWFSKIDYMENQGSIAVSMHPELKQLFLEVKKRIYYHIKYTLNLGCIYSKRLYFYLKSFEDTGWRIDNLDVLREKLQCPVSYSKYGLFRINVIDTAYKEINSHSDIRFEVEEIKTGRKVTHLKFLIHKKKNSKLTAISEIASTYDDSGTDIESVMAIIKEPISHFEAKKLLDSAKGDIQLIKMKYILAGKDSNIKNIVAWMLAAIQKDYKQLRKQKVDTFNDYEQRQYDFEKLEKALTGEIKVKEGESLLID